MRKILVTLFFLSTLGSAAFAETFTFGGKDLSIPDPQGFVLVTPEMDAVYRLGNNTTWATQGTENIGFYISELDLPVAVEGEIPSLEKTFRILGYTELKQIEIGKNDFSSFKKEMKDFFAKNVSDRASMIDSVAERYVKRFNIEEGEVFKEDFVMKYQKSILLEPHYENEYALSVSVYMNDGASIGGDSENPFWIAQTVTFLNVAGKILFALCAAPEDELEWTRDASKKWTEKIIASNDPPPTRTVHESGSGWDEAQNNDIEAVSFLLTEAAFFLLFVLIVSAIAAFIAWRLDKKLHEKNPLLLPYKWGYFVGVQAVISSVIFGILITLSFPEEPVGWFLYITPVLVSHVFIIRRNKWGWIFGVILHMNLISWIMNFFYAKKRWHEFEGDA